MTHCEANAAVYAEELIRQRDLLWAALAEIRSKVVMDLDTDFEDLNSTPREIYQIAKNAIEQAGLPLILNPPIPMA